MALVQLAAQPAGTSEELVAFARARISAATCPRGVRVVDSIPLTSVLETDRKALRALVRPAD